MTRQGPSLRLRRLARPEPCPESTFQSGERDQVDPRTAGEKVVDRAPVDACVGSDPGDGAAVGVERGSHAAGDGLDLTHAGRCAGAEFAGEEGAVDVDRRSGDRPSVTRHEDRVYHAAVADWGIPLANVCSIEGECGCEPTVDLVDVDSAGRGAARLTSVAPTQVGQADAEAVGRRGAGVCGE